MMIKTRNITQCIGLLLMLAFAGQCVQAQTDLFNGSHFKPYSNKWKMYTVDAQGKEQLVRIWTDYAQTINLNAKEYVSRVQELYDADMHLQELWTNLYERQTLIPYRASQFKTNGDHLYLEFDGQKVTSTSKQGNQEIVNKTYDLDEMVYDWTMYGVLLSGIPFEKGKSTRIPIFSAQSPNGTSHLIATPEAREMVKDENGKTHETWRIKTNFGLTFWLTKEAPYVIQLSLPGQGGGYSIWRIF